MSRKSKKVFDQERPPEGDSVAVNNSQHNIEAELLEELSSSDGPESGSGISKDPADSHWTGGNKPLDWKDRLGSDLYETAIDKILLAIIDAHPNFKSAEITRLKRKTVRQFQSL